MSKLTQEYVKSLFDYEDGNLYWKDILGRRTKIGDVVGCSTSSSGYNNTGINRKRYLTHRIIFLWHHGYLPRYIDHIDGNKRNNKIENLRSCTASENLRNSKMRKNNKSGVKGLLLIRNGKYEYWRGQIMTNGTICNKHSKDKDVVVQWLKETREELHGEYANHGV